MSATTIDYEAAVAAFERFGFPATLARKIVDTVVGNPAEQFTDAERQLADRCLRDHGRLPPPRPHAPAPPAAG